MRPYNNDLKILGMKKAIIPFLVLVLFLAACNKPKTIHFNTEIIKMYLETGKADVVIRKFNGVPFEMIDPELFEMLLDKAPGAEGSIYFYNSVAHRVKSPKIFEFLYNYQSSLINKLPDEITEEDTFLNFFVLSALSNQENDSLQYLLYTWYNHWDSCHINTADYKTSKEEDFHHYFGTNAYFTAFFLNRLGHASFSEKMLDSLKISKLQYSYRSLKLNEHAKPFRVKGKPVCVTLPKQIKHIQNIDFKNTPVFKDKYQNFKYKKGFTITTYYNKSNALVNFQAGFDACDFFVQMLDGKTISLQLIDERDIGTLMKRL
jgi:hypothetical protein